MRSPRVRIRSVSRKDGGRALDAFEQQREKALIYPP
jgi:hypothetical protein